MQYEYHKLANLFPLLEGKELDALAQDIFANGLREPITLYKKQILDGRNRYAACELAKVKPTFKEFDGDESKLLEFVVSANLRRRHLNESQRAMIAASVANMRQGERTDIEPSANLPKVSQSEAAEMFIVSERLVRDAVKIRAEADDDTIKGIEQGKTTIGAVAKKIKTTRAHARFAEQTKTNQIIPPTVELCDAIEWLNKSPMCDLLLTDAVYMTEVEDIQEFAQWLTVGLSKVKSTGRAYVFIGAYPKEVYAYLSVEIPDQLELSQMLIWTYKNTLGNNPKDRYKLNYQMCLYYKGVDAPDLDCPLTSEQWAVQEINAPDGRLGDRYHAWQKPIEIAERFIRHSTKPGDVVLDPFTCTGTFILAASMLGRVGLGCDNSKENLEIAIERGCVYA